MAAGRTVAATVAQAEKGLPGLPAAANLPIPDHGGSIVLYPVPRADQWDQRISATILAVVTVVLVASFLL